MENNVQFQVLWLGWGSEKAISIRTGRALYKETKMKRKRNIKEVQGKSIFLLRNILYAVFITIITTLQLYSVTNNDTFKYPGVHFLQRSREQQDFQLYILVSLEHCTLRTGWEGVWLTASQIVVSGWTQQLKFETEAVVSYLWCYMEHHTTASLRPFIYTRNVICSHWWQDTNASVLILSMDSKAFTIIIWAHLWLEPN